MPKTVCIPFDWIYEDIREIVGDNNANMIFEKLLLKYPSTMIYISKNAANRITYKNAYLMLKKQNKNKAEIAKYLTKYFDISKTTAYSIINKIEKEEKNEL